MKEFIVKQKLTIRHILDRVSQEEIFQYYLGIPIIIGEKFTAPSVIRIDNNPTCAFYYKGDKLVFRDFHPSSLWGDCFDMVGWLIGVPPTSSKQDFYRILQDIANKFPDRFGIEGTTNASYVVRTIFTERSKPVIDVVFRRWNQYDMEYWGRIGNKVTTSMLDMFEVYPVDIAYIYNNNRREVLYQYKNSDPCYAYYEGTDEDGIHNYRLYFPYRRKPRFYANNSEIQGMRQLKPSKYGLLTKSKKDIICLYSFGIGSVAPAGEGIFIPAMTIGHIKINYDYLGSLFDYDNAGIKAAIHYRKNYSIEPYFLADKLWGRKKGHLGQKDIADLNYAKGSVYTGNLIYSKIKQLENMTQNE